jgi:hypothetical protein
MKKYLLFAFLFVSFVSQAQVKKEKDVEHVYMGYFQKGDNCTPLWTLTINNNAISLLVAGKDSLKKDSSVYTPLLTHVKYYAPTVFTAREKIDSNNFELRKFTINPSYDGTLHLILYDSDGMSKKQDIRFVKIPEYDSADKRVSVPGVSY